MKYLIIGKNGQLGREFLRVLGGDSAGVGAGVSVSSVGREECDITDLNQILNLFEAIKPDIVINCAAYNQVDKAEEDYIEAFKVNSIGIRNIAFASKKYNSFLVHYSSDYVFDGKKENGLYTEEDIPNPLNEYGKSKLMGEQLLKEEIERYLIFRVSWVYGEGKQNFIYKLMQWAKNSEYLKIAYDEISVPTSTRTIADTTLKAIENGLTGLYHLTNSGYASRYEWAKEILKIKNIDKFIKPVSSDIFELPAKRPKFSAMSNEKIKSLLDIDIKSWDEELKEILKGNII